MLKRENVKGTDQVKVTFVLPHDPNQERIFVVGDFNDWDATETPLIKRSNNTRSASVVLAPDQRYSFRYRTADGQWFDDDAADVYEPNELGGQNCVIVT